jgi:hypothetical protein
VPYADWLPKQLPAWYQRQNGTQQWTAVGELLDAQRDQALQSELVGFPTKGALDTSVTPPVYTPPATDALDAQGFERVIQRAPAESDASYAGRLLGAWTTWRYGGSHFGVLRALQVAGYANMRLVQQNGRYSQLTGSSGAITDLSLGTLMTCATRSNRPGWMFDLRDDYFSIFAIVFTADASNLQTVPGQAILNGIVTQWKPSKTVWWGSAVILAGKTLGWPTGRTLGTDSALGGNSVRIIPGDGSAPFVVGP